MKRDLEEGLKDALIAAEANVNSVLGGASATLSSVAHLFRGLALQGATHGELEDFLRSVTAASRREASGASAVLGVYGFADGRLLDGIGMDPGPEEIPQKRPWYDLAVRREGARDVAFTEPYRDLKTGRYVVTAVINVYGEAGERLGILAMDVDCSGFGEYVRSFRVARQGYGAIVNKYLTVIGHKEESFVGRPLRESCADCDWLLDSLTRGEDSPLGPIVDYDGAPSIASFASMENGWRLGIVIPRRDYYVYVYRAAALIALLGAILAAALSYVLLSVSAAQTRADDENRGKSTFLARVSHEIRTPMNAIVGLSELALRGEGLSPLASEYLSGIKQAGHNLLAIINDILDFSKIESGRFEIAEAPYHLSSLLNDAVSVIRARLADRPILFTVNARASLPNKLIGDETRARQILLNLLSNAAKYTREGFVALDVEGEERGDGAVILKFSVSDSGVGIKGEDLPALFGDFARFDAKLNKGVEGAGLGLAIVKKLCVAMGGDVTVSSVYGEGSLFTATVPQRRADASPLARVEAPEEKSVVALEKNALRADSLARTLADLGTRAEIFSDPGEFRRHLATGPFAFAFVSPDDLPWTLDLIRDLKLSAAPVALARLGEAASMADCPVILAPAYAVPVANALNRESARVASPKPEARFVAPEASILLVDDIRVNLVVAQGLLAPYQARVDSCESGEEAIAMAGARAYDLILLDHMMPGLDGVETAARLRESAGARAPAIVALTANAVSGMREMFLKNGFDDFLSKPIDPLKLHEALRKWLPARKRRHVASGPARASAPPAEPPEDLTRVPGLNARVGLSRAEGSLAVYRETLKVFRADAAARLPFFSAREAARDARLFATQAHALKSAAASVGAMDIAREAAFLEEAASRGERGAPRSAVESFRASLAALVAAIPETPPAQEGDLPAATDQEETRLFQGLWEALAREDVGAVDQSLEGAARLGLRPKARAAADRIAELVLEAEFARAAEVAQKALGSAAGGRK
jgi:signal transduction histidine kinase/CheY-like chemotaxis protein/HPt (histidine-containing phosphotransfer) domain-containing protein